ncbi:hypothetical protein PGT21_011479 [Puccinia graminis f. sp. tritici]|nr:hypothetical protein PGT21_011479 [Puccinia graminis f. sp. tritici]
MAAGLKGKFDLGAVGILTQKFVYAVTANPRHCESGDVFGWDLRASRLKIYKTSLCAQSKANPERFTRIASRVSRAGYTAAQCKRSCRVAITKLAAI